MPCETESYLYSFSEFTRKSRRRQSKNEKLNETDKAEKKIAGEAWFMCELYLH